MTAKSSKPPPERLETIRQEILRHLQNGPVTARELSKLLKVMEKQIIPHLEHLDLSLRRSERRLLIDPAECVDCGFRFEKRSRFTRPGSCPCCHSNRIEEPAFRLSGHPMPRRQEADAVEQEAEPRKKDDVNGV